MGVSDVRARLDQLLRISSTTFYQTMLPTEQLLHLPENNAPAAAVTKSPVSPSAHAAADGPRIQLSPKRMHAWNPEEWKAFTKRLCTAVQDQLDDYLPAFADNKSLQAVFAAAQKKAPRGSSSAIHAEGEGEEGEGGARGDDASSSSSRPTSNAAEVCITQLLRCLSHDVSALLSDRTRASAGMDESLQTLVGSLARVQGLLMDPSFAQAWSGPEAKAQVADVFPNLNDVCNAAFSRWIEVQRVKVEGIRERSATLSHCQLLVAHRELSDIN
jgi:hypothetical protein